MTTFTLAKLTAINVNLKNGEITLTARIGLNDENYEKAERLKPYLDAEVGGVTIEITPLQPKLNLVRATVAPAEREATKAK